MPLSALPALPSLPVVLPLLAAAILAAIGNHFPRRLLDSIAIAISAAVCGVCIWLVRLSHDATIVYWFGNWKPQPTSHFPVGICFTIDPIGAGLAALVALLMLSAFIFSWAFFESIKSFYHTLMLVFLASMCGLCLTGDLFNLFVWFELMTAAGVGLCGYKSEERWPMLGSLNFAICNTVGAFISLTGIAMLYAFTGSLNMSEVGRSLLQHPPSTVLVSVMFLLVMTGFLVKAAAFPFHFWLADAHAVAPTPVCILFSGVMVELGIYAIARLYWVIFAPLLVGHVDGVRLVFLCMGCLGAVAGAIFCFGQRHFKRLLAFSTISHVGLMFIALGLLKTTALAGLAIYIVGHGLIKGALFICSGILLNRFSSVDEFDLRGRGREIWPIAILLLAGAWGLAGLPPFATYFGDSFVSHSAEEQHLSFLSIVVLFAEILTAGAVVRATGRIFLGLGSVREATSRGSPHIPMKAETDGGEGGAVRVCMWGPAAILLILGMILAAWPAPRQAVHHEIDRFRDGALYRATVLENSPPGASEQSPTPGVSLDWQQAASLVGMLLVAGLALFPGAVGAKASKKIGHWLSASMRQIRIFQSGRIGDYVTWIVFGVAAYGALLLLWHRGA